MKKSSMKESMVLVVDDEQPIRWALGRALRRWGYTPVEAADAATALSLYDAERPALVLLDLDLPDRPGLEVLREIKRLEPHAVVIIITGGACVENVVACMRADAYDFISKPFRLEDLQVTIRNALEAGQMRRELHSIRDERAQRFGFEQIIGESPAIRKYARAGYA